MVNKKEFMDLLWGSVAGYENATGLIKKNCFVIP
jgi:hypothetical protein